MKKSILFALLAVMGVSNANTLCTISNDVVTLPGNNSDCVVTPDLYQVKLYELMLCTDAPTAPTTSLVMDSSMCESVWTNTAGSLITVQNGVTSPLDGVISRPLNNSYSYGYARLSKNFTLQSSIKFNASANGDISGSGVYCSTKAGTGDANDANSTTCDSSAISAGSLISPLGDLSTDGNWSASGGDVNLTAYLVDTSQKLASDVNDVSLLIGIQRFTAPIIITDDSKEIDVSFNVSKGLSVNESGGNGTVSFNRGPFSVKISVK